MSYRKTNHSFSAWESYCEENQELIEELQFPNWIFKKEINFREFATSGQMNKENQNGYDFNKLEDELFWRLFDFINNYFDFDSILFTKFEESRINKGIRNERSK